MAELSTPRLGARGTGPGGPLVEIEHVRRSFGDVRALDDVSMTIRENEFFALLGPSGCGKTTLLRILAGFEHPDEGSVRLGGADLLALPPERRPINLMFQSYALFPHMSVEKNVAYGLEREGRPRDEVRARVADVLATGGIAETASRRPSQLSGGQRQRVALARAIVKRPRLLLLDEPLSALDRKVREEMQLELKRLQHEVGITFVVVTHDQEEAMSMADRIAVMRHGHLEQLDGPVDLYERPASLFVARFIGSNDLFEGVAAEGGVAVDGVGLLPAATMALPPGTRAWLGIRPEHVRVLGPGDPNAVLSGIVEDTQFQGGLSNIAVDVPGLAAPVLATQQGVARVTRGTPVALTWDPAKSVVLPAE